MAGAAQQEGVYRIGVKGKLLGAFKRVRVLPDAVPSPAGSSDGRSYGWVSGILPSPAKGDCYIVEFLAGDAFRILAYADPFGRVFTEDSPDPAPPARTPDLQFWPYEDDQQGDADIEEAGAVEVRTASGEIVNAAEYRLRRGRYEFSASWHDFGEHGAGLSLKDALARAYLAFVHRPDRFGAPIFECGLGQIGRSMRDADVATALSQVVKDVRAAQADAALRPPALAVCLAQWLEDAGVGALSAFAGPDPSVLHLARTARYADLFYLSADDDAPFSAVSSRMVWSIEAALNRALLVARALGDRAAEADMAECCEADVRVAEEIGRQVADAAHPELDRSAGEWDVRVRIASAIERLQLPYRVEAEFRMDASAGVVAFSVVVPDGMLMPHARWSDADGAWVEVGRRERDAQATRYGMRAIVLLAAIAFAASSSIRRVFVHAAPLDEEGPARGGADLARSLLSALGALAIGSDAPEDASSGSPSETSADDSPAAAPTPSPASAAAAALRADDAMRSAAGSPSPARMRRPDAVACEVAFDRTRFCLNDAYRAAAEGDPERFLRSFGLRIVEASQTDPFGVVRALPSSGERLASPEVSSGALSEEAAEALGTATVEGLRIFDKAERRRVAENLAGRICHATSAAESVAIVREVQSATGDPLVHESCTRLMAALAEGSIDATDQNEVVNAFLGEDPLLAAFGRARKVVGSSWKEALEILEGAVAAADAEGRFADSTEVVHRVFDTYSSRILYNLARAGSLPWIDPSTARAEFGTDANVELVPDALYSCCLEALNILERVPERVDEALRFGKRCMRLAPTIAAGYRQTARACMIAGRPLEARSVLTDCLRIAVSPEDASVAYYQIAFVEWNLGHFDAAVAAYLKAIDVSQVVAPQASFELRRLVSERNLPLLDHDDIDPALEQANIPVIPTDELVAVLDRSIAAAVDIGAFPVAHNLLSLRLRHRPDDALASVARSLT